MDRRPKYEPCPDIARLKSFNAVAGFKCYHVKWTIGKLSGSIDSKCFQTNFTNEFSWKREQEWQLQLFIKGEEYSTTGIDLRRNFNSGEDEDVPIIARVKLMNESKANIEYASTATFLLAHTDWAYQFIIPEDDATKLSNTDLYVVHCWIDIPKNYNREQNYGQNSGLTLLASSIARSFDKITVKNGDPTSDIELVIKDGSEDPPRFYCHRHILAARSPVFETMFTNDRFKESNERIVEIEDMDGKTLKLLLQYLYTGRFTEKYRCDEPKELLLSLLNAAEKYMLPELKDECAWVLIGGGNSECDDAEWIEHLQLAETFNLEYLKKVCMLALSTNMRLFGEEQRGLVSPQSMTKLLEMVTKRGEITQTIEVKTED